MDKLSVLKIEMCAYEGLSTFMENVYYENYTWISKFFLTKINLHLIPFP